jgi:polysaccharide deacetylase family protein (PEP-CTERM system associated)
MIHALTIDVEDYHNILARDWLGRDGPPTEAVVRNTHWFLDTFASRHVRATFFVLGEVAQTFPHLLRDIAAGGHEVGVHGFFHRQVFKLTPEAFRREICDARAVIEDLAGTCVQGHRAPAFSIMPDTAWALEILAEAGFRYDASIFPIAGRRYGWPGFPPDIHERLLPNGRRIIEAPPSTVSILGKRLPAGGGGYLRHFPGALTCWAIRRIQRCRPAIVYMHPYEIEVDVPPIDTAGLAPQAARRAKRFHRMQLRNRHTVRAKVLRLLAEFEFAPLHTVIDQVLAAARPASPGA